MRRYGIAIAPAVAETIRDLHPEIKKSVRNALEALGNDPKLGIALRGELVGLWRYRVRRFRIIYEVVGSTRTIRIVAIGHRKTVYEDIADRRRDARLSEQRKPKRRGVARAPALGIDTRFRIWTLAGSARCAAGGDANAACRRSPD